MTACNQEMCPNWGGDGRVCACALLEIEPRILPPYLGGDEDDDPHDGCTNCPYGCPECPRCDCCACEIDHQWEEENHDAATV